MTIHKHIDFEVPQWGELAQGPAVSQGYASAVLSLNPLGYWRLGEQTGSVAIDHSGNEHNGQYVGSVTLDQQGCLDRDNDTAAHFAGGHITLNNAAASHPLKPSFPFSIAAWVKPTTTTGYRWIYSIDGFGTVYYGAGLQLNPGNTIAAHIGNGQTFGRRTKATTNALAADTWQFVVAVFHGVGDYDIYIDGQNAAGTYSGSAASMIYSNSPSYIGNESQQSAQPIIGGLDEVALFNTALTASDVADLLHRARCLMHLPN